MLPHVRVHNNQGYQLLATQNSHWDPDHRPVPVRRRNNINTGHVGQRLVSGSHGAPVRSRFGHKLTLPGPLPTLPLRRPNCPDSGAFPCPPA